ncbi:MAG: acyltransferase domain-containing protein, partial [Thermodesulfobacteriota bacterium]|nr:acyltransferase domain-containing protein [Thermodesulfobacteriota bacterium]
KSDSDPDNDPGLRAAIIANHPDQLAERLNRLSTILRETPPDPGRQYHDAKNQIWVSNRMTAPRIGFLFPGQGAQQLNMAKRLIDRHDWARNTLALADRLLTRDGHKPIGPIIYRDLDQVFGSDRAKDWAKKLARTENAQPAICLASILWLQWLEEVGVRPTAVGGHSLGELTAFHAAGAFDADTLIRFSGSRGWICADQAEKDGAMIGLRCSKKRAKNLLKKVGPYAVLANINSPRQVVIAGKKPAIKHISKLATEAGIPAYRLAVSGAFHTKLVAKAAKAIKKETILPSVLTEPSCRIFSGMDGREIKSGRMLKDYFADQILTPVNFTSLIQSMTEICDLFIEVGPGQALTGMINDINGDTGPLCLPVESAPGRDRDINKLLATLFVRGTEINWDKIYESRLIRPFIPPSERLFFENPCERPFETTVSVEPSIGLSPPELLKTESLETLFAGLGDISREKIESYLKTRGPFLARVIQADMEYTRPETQWVSPPETSNPAEIIESHEIEENHPDTDESIDSIFFNTLESITGFSRDTLSPDMRLLDDLNLDSIKTGDLLTRVARIAGIAGEITPLDFANVTLEDIVQKLNLAKAKKIMSLESEKPDILASILDQVAKLIGDSPLEINADAVVEKDLNISKGQFKKILPGLSHRLKVDIHVDLDPLLKRTLRQIASILQRISDQQQQKSSFSHETDHPPWIREFHLSMNTPRPPQPAKEAKRREDDWQYARALILADTPENEVARAVAGRLSELGAGVDVSTHTKALEQNL